MAQLSDPSGTDCTCVRITPSVRDSASKGCPIHGLAGASGGYISIAANQRVKREDEAARAVERFVAMRAERDRLRSIIDRPDEDGRLVDDEHEAWKAVLPDLVGRKITGYATVAIGGHLTSLTVTLDDGSVCTLSVPALASRIDVALVSPPPASPADEYADELADELGIPRLPRGVESDPTIAVDLTAPELHVLTCAMAGNHPPTLADVRMPALRKLARADRTLREAFDG